MPVPEVAFDDGVLVQRSADAPMFRDARHTYTATEVAGDIIDLIPMLPDVSFAINLCSERLSFTIGLLAAIARGHCVLLPQNRQPQTLSRLGETYGSVYWLVDGPGTAEAGTPWVRVIAGSGKRASPRELPRIPDEQHCVRAFTSGTTGTPTGHLKLWRTLVHGGRVNGAHVFGGLESRPATVCTIPPQHMYGLECSVLAPVLADITSGCTRPFYPGDIAAELEAAPRPRVLVTTPIHLRALLRSGKKLPRTDRVISATAPLAVALAEKAERCFANRLLEVYGCTEAGAFAWREPTVDERWHVFEGPTLDTRAEGTTVRAPYLPHSVELQDRLEQLAPGEFRLVGRASDLVNVAGKRESLADLTIKLLAIEGVEDGIIFERPASGCDTAAGRLTGLVVTRRPIAQIRQSLRATIDPVFLPRPLIAVPCIPRGENGKVQRAELLEVYARASAGDAGNAGSTEAECPRETP